MTFGIPRIYTEIQSGHWCAFCADDEPDDNGNMAVGVDKTETAAIADLIENNPRDRAA
jgi:hypothetical protein